MARRDYHGQEITRREALRLRCVDCCGGQSRGDDGPEGCTSYSCPAWGYRRGGEWEPVPEDARLALGWPEPVRRVTSRRIASSPR